MKLIASARAATILPLLMLPLAVASLWLLVAPQVVEPRVLVIVGAVVVAWYLLGGWIAVQRLSQGVTLARQARTMMLQVQLVFSVLREPLLALVSPSVRTSNSSLLPVRNRVCMGHVSTQVRSSCASLQCTKHSLGLQRSFETRIRI